MAPMRDPYAVLGVARDTADDEIKRAYRKLAKRLHPDLNPGKRAIEQQFKEITAAYDLLSDPAKRSRYDRGEIGPDGAERMRGFRHSGAGPGAGFGGARGGRRGGGAGFGGLDDIIAEFLGRGGRRGPEAPAQKLKVSFLEAARGGKQRVALADGRSLDVAVPAGIEAGQRLRLHGPAGDTYLEIEIEPHPLFTRKDRDIHIEVPVTLVEAVLGATITVPTIHGAVALKVPRGSNSGATLRLKGKGLHAAPIPGDQYVKLKVTLPDPPDPELVRFLERWSADHAYDVRGKLDPG
ncbi:MAG TPA: DnaJ C-terminal domain-containing protein [Stellaceae bacterium]|nr:DnaJ C-terminal domain-containing protein [Stellaceae bacterium]